MARRPDQREAPGFGRLDGNACGEQRRGIARLRRDRVGVQQAWLRERRQRVQVLGRVYTFDRGAFRRSSLTRVGERRKQPLEAFRRVQIAERGM
jgi:hypothetical protein